MYKQIANKAEHRSLWISTASEQQFTGPYQHTPVLPKKTDELYYETIVDSLQLFTRYWLA